MKPRILRETFKQVTIKVGRSHKWVVDYLGEPDPDVSWIFKDSTLSNGDRINIENTDHHTEFAISNAKRKDAGLYTLKIENRNGKDEETVELVILGMFLLPNIIEWLLCKFSCGLITDIIVMITYIKVNTEDYILNYWYATGKPSKPRGPLEVSNVHDTGCKLKWKEPEDDGGMPIKEYEIEKMDLATGKWVRAGKVG